LHFGDAKIPRKQGNKVFHSETIRTACTINNYGMNP